MLARIVREPSVTIHTPSKFGSGVTEDNDATWTDAASCRGGDGDTVTGGTAGDDMDTSGDDVDVVDRKGIAGRANVTDSFEDLGTDFGSGVGL